MCTMAGGDVLLSGRSKWLMDRIVASGSLVLRRVGGNCVVEVECRRILDNGRVDASAIGSPTSMRRSLASPAMSS